MGEHDPGELLVAEKLVECNEFLQRRLTVLLATWQGPAAEAVARSRQRLLGWAQDAATAGLFGGAGRAGQTARPVTAGAGSEHRAEESRGHQVNRALLQFPLPEWVRLIPMGDSDTAEGDLVALLSDAQPERQGFVRGAEFESIASDVVAGAVEAGIWLLALATPPGRPAALLSVTGFRVPGTADQYTTTDLLSQLEDRGGPGIEGARLTRLEHGQTALLMHRTDSSGSQAQAFVPDADGGGCLLFTLAAPQPDRGPELLELICEVVTAAVPVHRP
ncbi:hypothetical protein [Actinophytocola sp.]|uniref:hypothetical protein n=1 Tax=Actinophytocola sp. TaxID=1872138 RepID=UPI002ECFBB61